MQAADSVRSMCESSLAKGEGLNPEANDVPKLMKASIDKIDFDAYQAQTKLSADGGVPHALIMGSHLDHMDYVWSKNSEKISFVDFEHIGYGPIVADLCIMMCQLIGGLREKNESSVL